MEDTKKFKIAVLEDSEFYNRILTQRLVNFTDELALYLNCCFRISTFVHPNDFFRNLSKDTDIAIIDFYLQNELNGSDICRGIENYCNECEIVVISQSRKALNAIRNMRDVSPKIIFKDGYALSRACFFIEDYTINKLTPGLEN